MDAYKKENVVKYTVWDLNCRRVVPHSKKYNELERRLRRLARRKLKYKLVCELSSENF